MLDEGRPYGQAFERCRRRLRLTEKQALVAYGRVILHRSMPEIASSMGISLSAVKAHDRAARRKAKARDVQELSQVVFEMMQAEH